ncbi:MAG: BON domain-containing protein [Sphingobacteriales bacterium]|jgi:osmotically-inducible protein OsmY
MKCVTVSRNWLWIAVIALLFASCKPSDEKIAEAVKAKIGAVASTVNVSVADGVATLTGEVKDDATKAAAETALQGIKGLKSVVNSLTVPPPPPPPVVINPDDVLRKGIDSVFAAKSIKGVTAAVAEGVVTLTGTIKKSELTKVMQAANELKPKKVLNQLTIK